MRFKEFLQEARHREDISIEKAIELLKANCGKALANSMRTGPLLRGTKSSTEDAYLIQGEVSHRESAHSNTNYYTVIMDNVLTDYPRRANSIILGNNANEDYVSDYGTVYAIFPFDSVKIGVCDNKDIWLTRIQVGSGEEAGLQRWNETWERFGLDESSYSAFVADVKQMMSGNTWQAKELNKIFGVRSNVEFELKKAYGAKSMNLNLATTKNISQYDDKPRELWIGGKCVGIKLSVWEKLKDTL